MICIFSGYLPGSQATPTYANTSTLPHPHLPQHTITTPPDPSPVMGRVNLQHNMLDDTELQRSNALPKSHNMSQSRKLSLDPYVRLKVDKLQMVRTKYILNVPKCSSSSETYQPYFNKALHITRANFYLLKNYLIKASICTFEVPFVWVLCIVIVCFYSPQNLRRKWPFLEQIGKEGFLVPNALLCVSPLPKKGLLIFGHQNLTLGHKTSLYIDFKPHEYIISRYKRVAIKC